MTGPAAAVRALDDEKKAALAARWAAFGRLIGALNARSPTHALTVAAITEEHDRDVEAITRDFAARRAPLAAAALTTMADVARAYGVPTLPASAPDGPASRNP